MQNTRQIHAIGNPSKVSQISLAHNKDHIKSTANRGKNRKTLPSLPPCSMAGSKCRGFLGIGGMTFEIVLVQLLSRSLKSMCGQLDGKYLSEFHELIRTTHHNVRRFKNCSPGCESPPPTARPMLILLKTDLPGRSSSSVFKDIVRCQSDQEYII